MVYSAPTASARYGVYGTCVVFAVVLNQNYSCMASNAASGMCAYLSHVFSVQRITMCFRDDAGEQTPCVPTIRRTCVQITGPVVLCPECGHVAYCGRACLTAALQEWHGSECLDASSCTPLGPALSGVSPTCMVALRAYKRARRQAGPLPKRTEPRACTASADAADVAVTVTETQDACHDRFGSVASSPARGGGDDVAWPKVKLGNLQEHYAARSARERDLLETEAAVTAVLAGGFGSGTALDADSLGTSDSGRGATRTNTGACELVAAELVTTLVKVGAAGYTRQ